MPTFEITPFTNACMSAKLSCSACCGIYNLDMTPEERRFWLEENTAQFMALDLSLSENIVRFRREREAVTLPRRLRKDIYVCPFVGFVHRRTLRTGSRNERPRAAREPDASLRTGSRSERPPAAREPDASLRTGCLLHPQGSPHPQIGLYSHPQNFSFYGEGICQSYDCLAKERGVYRLDFFRWAENAQLDAYGRLASDHTLHRSLALFVSGSADLAKFYRSLAEIYERYRVVTTSFEDIEKVVPESAEALCSFLAKRVAERRATFLGAKTRSDRQFVRRLSALLLKILNTCLK